jgi:hypothetical protein
MFKTLYVSVLAFQVSMVCALAQGTDFSAEMVATTKGDARPSIQKIYVHGDRIKLVDATPDQRSSGEYMVYDIGARKMYWVMPDHQAYMDVSAAVNTSRESPWLLFRPHNPDDACPDWQQLSSSFHTTLNCKKVGIDVVTGRPAMKYEGSEAGKSDRGYVWMDSKLGFLLKMQDEKSVTVLQNIKEGPQPAYLRFPRDSKRWTCSTRSGSVEETQTCGGPFVIRGG